MSAPTGTLPARKSKHLGAKVPARRPGLGRSRGVLTGKIILTAADEDTAIAVDVRPGQAHDAPLLKPMLERTVAGLSLECLAPAG